jgi:hypothetical protein
MPITSHDVAYHAKQELDWFERKLTFRKALRAISQMDAAPTELLIFLLTGELLGGARLFALTTECICTFGPTLGPFGDVSPLAWRGDDIRMLTVHDNRLIRINLHPGVAAAGNADYVEIAPFNPQLANTFINLANLLCLFHLWGDAEGFAIHFGGVMRHALTQMQTRFP